MQKNVSQERVQERVQVFKESTAFGGCEFSLTPDDPSEPSITTNDFHTYRVLIKGDDLLIHVDGELRIKGRHKFTHPAHQGRNSIAFGASNSPNQGEALWNVVSFQSQNVSLYDVVLAIRYRARKSAKVTRRPTVAY